MNNGLPPGLREFVFANMDLANSPEAIQFTALSGDAGFRRYYRCNTQPPVLAVHAPPATEDSAQFCAIAAHLKQSGVNTPDIYAKDYDKGFLIVEDFGGDTLLNLLSDKSVDGYYQSAMDVLHAIQRAPTDRSIYPQYSKDLLNKELDLFDDWFLGKWLELSLSSEEMAVISDLKRFLTDEVAAQPEVIVHRDYHSRNLMVLDDGSLGVLDFQDAVIGPWTYDLVSLLKDCYVKWPVAQVREWAMAFAERSPCSKGRVGEEALIKDFDLMGLQRHLKVLGIFCRLYLRDGKTAYLADLPMVFEYVCEVCSEYDALRAFESFMLERVAPVFNQKQGRM